LHLGMIINDTVLSPSKSYYSSIIEILKKSKAIKA
jgi:hypothetical protein